MQVLLMIYSKMEKYLKMKNKDSKKESKRKRKQIRKHQKTLKS
jgi:hypothetical protein